MIFYNYEGYFGKPKVVEESVPTGPDTGSFNYRKWQWHLMVYKLVKELNLTPESIYEMNYIACLNWLSMFSDIEKQQKINNG